jgi:WD40 repeat protein
MCPTPHDLLIQSSWDGAHGQSRTTLLSEISKFISPSVMIPEHRLATLLTSVQEDQILDCRYHNTTAQPSLYTDHDCPADDFPLHTYLELAHHTDEVWHLEFSPDGTMLATAGRDGLVCVYDTARWRLKYEFREHERSHHHAPTSSSAVPSSSTDDRGVCYVSFSPDSTHLISCSKTNDFVIVNVQNGQRVAHVDDFDYPVACAAWLPDSQHFVIGSQSSQRPLGLYSLADCISSYTAGRLRSGVSSSETPELHSWRDPPWNPDKRDGGLQPNSFRVTDCTVNTSGTRLAATTVDNRILLFSLDRSSDYGKIAEWIMDDKLTSINFSADGELLLVNMNEGRVLALDSETGEIVMRFEGMVQRGFVIRSGWGGAGEGLVGCGSEDSKVLIWRRATGLQVAALDAHAPGAVNAVAWHPKDVGVFASAGDDRRVRM